MPATPICESIAHIGPDADFLHLDGETLVATAPPKAGLGAALLEDENDGSPVLSLLSLPPLPRHPSATRPFAAADDDGVVTATAQGVYPPSAIALTEARAGAEPCARR